MKSLYTFFGIGLSLLILTSCESEYDRQLKLGKDVIKQSIESEIIYSDRLEFSAHPIKQVETIDEKIDYHAHMSGNSELFHKELEEYKTEIEKDARQIALK